MRTLLVRCGTDVPSVNMADALLRMAEWSDLGEADGMSFRETDGFLMVSTDGLHINSEDIDRKVAKAGHSFDNMVFLSRHRAASGKPTLTVHPIGNYGAADFGGKPETLCPADPHFMTALFRGFSSAPQPEGFSSSFEVTHHGPFVSKPAMFLEIGSCEETWGNKEAAELLAKTLLEERPRDFPVVVGVGGGHYAPRFSEIAASYEVDFGHMLPSYHMKDVGDETLLDMVGKACDATGSKTVYLHRKAFGRPEGRRIMELIESAGYETIASKDLNPAGTSR
ncbi:MAG: hypothetical protein GX224_03840 [Thermoplasmatales archaeon]|nr:hypothetical protein [Thermoplasmatales archaeon]